MNEFANVLGKQISKMGMIPFGKQNLGRIAKAAGRIQAASYGLQPLQKKSTEIEWKLAQAKRLTFSLEIKIKEFEGYREKRKQLVHDFVDSFQL
jgi:ribosome recycling factor